MADAGTAMVAGVAGRSRIVAHPRFVRAALALRGALQPLLDLQARRHMADDDRFAMEQIEARGADASAPVGAGGAADREVAARR